MFNLNREQKQAVGLLSIGTFLEYFDLMLYVHMAVLLNELFFPKTDPHTATLLAAFAFCSTFVFRPIGAAIFGYIGDHIGRKATVVITTMLMATSCIVMANLPTYAQIGITASWVVIICRIAQGISSIGEIIGVELYLTETIKPPVSFQSTTLIGALSALGGTAALAVASFATSLMFNWRIAFLVGAGIALIGTVARIALRETPEFADAKLRIKNAFNRAEEDPASLNNTSIYKEKVNKLTVLSLFLMDCTWPVCFYFAYIYCGNILKDLFHYNAEQVIYQNFLVSMSELFSLLALIYVSYKMHPLKILKILMSVFFIFILVCPYLLGNARTPFNIFLVQSFAILFGPTIMVAVPVLFKHFPIFKRFTCVSLIHAISRAVIYVITSFGFIYLIQYFGHWGLLVITIPTTVGFWFGLYHFEKLESKKVKNYQ